MTDRSAVSLLGLGVCPWSKRRLRTGFTCGSSQAWGLPVGHGAHFHWAAQCSQHRPLGRGCIGWLLTESLFYFSRAVLQDLENGLKKADADPSVKAVMICGENGKFSAGKTSNTG